MSVERYSLALLEPTDCPLMRTPDELLVLLKAWRKNHTFERECKKCRATLLFDDVPYTLCCEQFYFNEQVSCYPVRSLAISTPGYTFMMPQLQRMISKADISTDQQFLILPDPIYWQLSTTLTYEKVAKFVKGVPMTCRTQNVQPPSKSALFYRQIQEAPLNYGSLDSRSCGKATLIRQVSFGKRCRLSMRGMIVPDASLPPNRIRLPDSIVRTFGLKGKWLILNRMPSLQPENMVALQVAEDEAWPHDCFGIPLEIIKAINGDFDGDECNLYLVPNVQSQAECAALMNPKWEMGCFVMGLKLSPSQDMLVAYHLFYEDVDFLPYKSRDLNATFRVIYEVYGSKECFRAFDLMRQFYLDRLQRHTCFALSLEEMQWLHAVATEHDFETFQDIASRRDKGCLVAQVLAGAKGSFEHLYQMFGKIGRQDRTDIQNSFWTGLTPLEAVAHAQTSNDALSQSGKIWQPGYGYTKIAFNVHDVKVDYLGRLMDGNDRVIERDVLDVMHHTDAMTEETFDYLVSEVLVQGKSL